MIRSAPADVRTKAEEVVQKYLAPHAATIFQERLHWLVVDAIMRDRKETSRLTSEDDAPTESVLRPLADRGKSADDFMDQASNKRCHAATLITDAEVLEQLAYDTADYCGGGES